MGATIIGYLVFACLACIVLACCSACCRAFCCMPYPQPRRRPVVTQTQIVPQYVYVSGPFGAAPNPGTVGRLNTPQGPVTVWTVSQPHKPDTHLTFEEPPPSYNSLGLANANANLS